jgi:hypothetical protein
MISDNLARAFDMGGANLWIDSNTFGNTGSAPGNDGEGILCQLHGGTHWISWALTRNVNEGSEGGNGRGMMCAFDVKTFGALMAWNRTEGMVGVVNRNNETADMAFVANETPKLSPGGALTESHGKPRPPEAVKAEPQGGDAVKVTWADASDNEIGFRVERSVDGGRTWTAVAYRPPRIQGHERNPQAWVDYLAPRWRRLVYRVIAIDASDDASGASRPAGPVALP